ncbi:MAG: hypothetical protein ABFD49_03815 [Armatimonadota bacterium]|nr:hypothetical protein [bacterium]
MILTRKTAATLAAILVFSTTSVMALAAKGASKVYVPKNILKGAKVASGRAFYKTNVPEDSLAGIRLGREAKEILVKWGNPSRITVGSVSSDGAAAGVPGSPADASSTNPFVAMAPGLNTAAGMLGMQGSSFSGTGLPTLPGMPVPGTAAIGQALPNGGTNSTLTEEEVTWTYDLNGGITLEFIITDGLITQITVGGSGPWGLSKTRTGLQLGDTYKLTLWVCGYPESQKYVGRFLRVSYVNKNRALFTFLKNKLVGVTIAMVPTELTLQ